MINHVRTVACPIVSSLDESACGELLTSTTSSNSSSVCEERPRHFMVKQCSMGRGVTRHLYGTSLLCIRDLVSMVRCLRILASLSMVDRGGDEGGEDMDMSPCEPSVVVVDSASGECCLQSYIGHERQGDCKISTMTGSGLISATEGACEGIIALWGPASRDACRVWKQETACGL